jgi:hypothetical protein
MPNPEHFGERTDRQLCARDGDCEFWWVRQRLEYDAVPLGQAKKGVELFLVRVDIQLKSQPNGTEPNESVLRNSQRASKVEITLSDHLASMNRNLEGCGNRSQRDTRARGQGLQEHVARTQQRAVTTRRRV